MANINVAVDSDTYDKLWNKFIIQKQTGYRYFKDYIAGLLQNYAEKSKDI